MMSSNTILALFTIVALCWVVTINSESCSITNLFEVEEVGGGMCHQKSLFHINCDDPVILKALKHLDAGPMPTTASAFPCPSKGPRTGGCNYTVDNIERSDFGPDGQPQTCGDWIYHASCLNAREVEDKLPCSDKKRPGGG